MLEHGFGDDDERRMVGLRSYLHLGAFRCEVLW